MVAFNLGVYLLNVKVQLILSVNGAVIGYIYVIIVPIWIHLKCVWVDHHSGYIEADEEWNAKIEPNPCHCNCSYSSKWTLYLETSFLVLTLLAGLLLAIFTLKEVNTLTTPTHQQQ
jgi:hypothetical protein